MKKYNKGFTLIELLIVLSLFVVLLAGIFSIISIVQKSYCSADTRSKVMEKVNLALMVIDKDIRSASKPNKLTNSIIVHSAEGNLSKGQSMDVYYHYHNENDNTDKYYRIGYRLLPIDKSKLQRGWVECTDPIPPVDTAKPFYGEIIDDSTDYESGEGGKWKTILDGVEYEKGSINIEIFEDITEDADSERRTIKVTFVVNDTEKPLKVPVTIEKSLTSRTKGIPTN
ncbi:MAG TPA: prepilin-type N-terminal cleavage/methylation domain-containing protein [Clostridiaceae bacterium]|jgi:type II secretion system protein J|nr:prepilin-type N-terminal cleavage/methylation domain-containing protein [Clostridiaceae bacterium]